MSLDIALVDFATLEFVINWTILHSSHAFNLDVSFVTL